MTEDKNDHAVTRAHKRVGGERSDNKVQMHTDLNRAYNVLIELTHKLDLKAFNADLLDGRAFLSRMVDHSDYPPMLTSKHEKSDVAGLCAGRA